MTDEAGEVSNRAWSIYLMMHTDVDENDQRRSTLQRYVRKMYRAGERDFDELISSGLTYLKKLDVLGDFEACDKSSPL